MKPAEQYILNQPEHLQTIMLHLCAVIEQVAPESELLFKWKLPFYYYKKKPFCYLNIKPKENAVDLCFMKGHLLKKHKNAMIDKDRKLVTSLLFDNLSEIDNTMLSEILTELKSLYL
jgi:hypothetical protein